MPDTEPPASRLPLLLGESLRILLSRPLLTAASVIVVAAGITVPLVVTMQSARLQYDAAMQLQRPELRTLRITDTATSDGSTALDRRAVEMFSSLSVVERVTALGTTVDVRDSATWPAGERLPMVDVLIEPDAKTCGTAAVPNAYGPASTLHLAVEEAYIPVHSIRSEATVADVPANLAVRYVCDWEVADTLIVTVIEASQLDTARSLVATMSRPTLVVDLPDDLTSLRQQLTAGLSQRGQQLRLAALFGAAGLVGIAMLVRVATDTRNIARRRALGATRSDIAVLVLAQTVTTIIAGVLLAAAPAAVAAATLEVPVDPGLVGAITLVMGLTSVVLSLPSAALASTRDPARVLRVP